MLKFVLVGCGNKGRLEKYVCMLQKELRYFIKQHGLRVYNMKKIQRAETNVKLLNKSSNFYFPTNKATTIEYWGVVENVSMDELYSCWFSDVSDSNVTLNRNMPYDRTRMELLIKDSYSSAENLEKSAMFDFKILYRYENLEDKDLCIIELVLSSRMQLQEFVSYFEDIIVGLDRSFTDVFLSAYTTDESADFTEAQFQYYHYNYDLLEFKIVDIGHMFYVCNRIEMLNDLCITEVMQQYTVKELLNGKLYEHRSYDVCNCALKKSSISVFDKIRMPKYRVFNWSDLCKCERLYVSVDELISIYYDFYSPNDPTVVFSFGYTYEQIDSLPMLVGLVCQERYYVKEIINC